MHVSRLSSLPPPPPPSPPAALAASSEGLTSFFVSNSQVGVKDVPLEPPYNNNLYNNNLRSVSPSLSNTYQVHACILLLLTCFASTCLGTCMYPPPPHLLCIFVQPLSVSVQPLSVSVTAEPGRGVRVHVHVHVHLRVGASVCA